MNLIADRIKRIKPSMTVGINIKAKAMKEDGKDVIVLAAGEPDFNTPKNIRDAANKATRFIANCNQKNIPLIFLQDVTGFMVGSKAEHAGIIKDGAKMVNAVANSVVPKFTIIIGNSFGAGNYAMCGKAFDPRLILAWPTAKIAVMGGSQAAEVLLQIQKSSALKNGEQLDEKKESLMKEKIKNKYDEKTDVVYAASQLWVDAVIDPAETRSWISMGIEIANQSPIDRKFNMGILQV